MRLETCGWLFVGVVLGTTACTGIRVSQDYDPAADFSAYRSWYWLPRSPSGDARIENDLVRARVRSAVERALAAKGYAQAPTGEGDLGVGWHAAIEGRIDVRSVDHFYGYGRRWGPYGGMATETIVREYEEGSLILDMVDSRSGQLVWWGSAQAEVRANLEPHERSKRTQEAVDCILAQFPPS
jgi:hypothetical protein